MTGVETLIKFLEKRVRDILSEGVHNNRGKEDLYKYDDISKRDRIKKYILTRLLEYPLPKRRLRRVLSGVPKGNGKNKLTRRDINRIIAEMIREKLVIEKKGILYPVLSENTLRYLGLGNLIKGTVERNSDSW